MHDHLKFIPQFVITQFEKLEKITFSKTQKIKMALYTHRRVVYNFFQICKKLFTLMHNLWNFQQNLVKKPTLFPKECMFVGQIQTGLSYP